MLDELLKQYEVAYKQEWGVGLSEFMKTAAMDVFRWLDSESRLTSRAADGAYWCSKCNNWSKSNASGNCVLCNTPRR